MNAAEQLKTELEGQRSHTFPVNAFLDWVAHNYDHESVDQDWERGRTSYTFEDGSALCADWDELRVID